jgi:hypothetical protein
MVFHPEETHQRGIFSEDSQIQLPTPFKSALTERPLFPTGHRLASAAVVATNCREGLIENDWVCGAYGFE